MEDSFLDRTEGRSETTQFERDFHYLRCTELSYWLKIVTLIM